MGYWGFAHPFAKGVLQLGLLDEDVVLRIVRASGLGSLEVEAQPFLNTGLTGARCEVHEQREVEDDWRREDRVASQQVDLDLHWVAEPSEDVDVVPTLFFVATRWVVVDPYFVIDVAVERWVHVGLKDRVEHTELGGLFGLEVLGSVENFAVAVAQDVGRVPAANTEHAALEPW